MTNTLSFFSPYITLSSLHSLHPQKHLNGTLQNHYFVSKGAIRGEPLFCFKRSHKERIVFVSKTQSFVFKFCHIHNIKTISNGLHILKGVIRRGLFLTKIHHLIWSCPELCFRLRYRCNGLYTFKKNKRERLQEAVHILIKKLKNSRAIWQMRILNNHNS